MNTPQTPKPARDAAERAHLLAEAMSTLLPKGHDRCHVDSSCAGGPEPCREGRAR